MIEKGDLDMLKRSGDPRPLAGRDNQAAVKETRVQECSLQAVFGVSASTVYLLGPVASPPTCTGSDPFLQVFDP